jgi:5'-3' exonuclease
MGVPGFFLWLWKKYKSSNFVFTKQNNNINDIDCFLLDMNCMIHPICFETIKELNGIDSEYNLDKLEKKMYSNIIKYLEKLIDMAEPKKKIFIAIDGVAPVAKMKQQRLRRYKSINDKELFDKIRKKHKKEIPYFWNNSAITPGTMFMKKLTEILLEWANTYKSNNIEIIFSPSNVPGEGEHKLLQYIRDNKQFSYIVYGLDADLIFLTLATGLDNIYLMREGDNMDNKKTNIMNYVSIKIMKECIINSIKEINEKKDNIFEIINDRIIDDFIFICYLMGNDFLPHIPALDIYNNAIDILLDIYVENNNYIIDRTNEDYINSDNLYNFLVKLASNEELIIVENYGKKKRKAYCQSTDPFDIEMHKIDNMMFKINDPIELGNGKYNEWRKRFYNHYYHVEEEELNEFTNKMVSHYMKGLKWVSIYYFDKCPSWEWFYPYDHAPFLNDMIMTKYNFNKILFNKSKPLTAFEQLLTVLPKQSAYLLPKELRKIMLNINGSINHLYPEKYELDLIGKKKYWMAIPILPCLEINLIKKVFEKYSKLLSDDMIELNKFGENKFII